MTWWVARLKPSPNSSGELRENGPRESNPGFQVHQNDFSISRALMCSHFFWWVEGVVIFVLVGSMVSLLFSQ